MEAMTFFFGAENPLSNWHPATFVVNGVRFVNTEQFMMFCKAKMFGDEEIASKIINATTPRDHKALGRQVRGFDEAKCLMQVREQLLKDRGQHKIPNSTNNTLAYQAQAGDLQNGPVTGFQQVVFINGQVGSIDAQGFFETIVVFTEQELMTYDLETEQGKINFDWDSAYRAVGSAQVTHQSMTKIGSLPDGRVFFLLRGGVLALPHEKVGDCLPKV